MPVTVSKMTDEIGLIIVIFHVSKSTLVIMNSLWDAVTHEGASNILGLPKLSGEWHSEVK